MRVGVRITSDSLLHLLQDLMTDLNAESEPLPIRPVKEEWMGHKVSSLFFIDYSFKLVFPYNNDTYKS